MGTDLAKIKGAQGLSLIALNNFDPAKYNTLMPASVGDLSEAYSQRHFIVQLNPAPDAGDFYKEKNGKLAMTKRALDTLADAAGVIWYAPGCKRLDDMRNANYCSFQAVGGLRRPDGSVTWVTCTKEIDIEALRDAGQSADQLKQVRVHKVALCETKARLRVLRALLHIKSTYTPDEAAKPFVCTQVYLDPTKSEEARAAWRVRIAKDYDELFGVAPNRIQGPAAVAALPEGVVQAPEDDEDDDEGFDSPAHSTGDLRPGDLTASPIPEAQDEQGAIEDARAKVAALIAEKGTKEQQVHAWCQKHLGCSYAEATLDGLNALIEALAAIKAKSTADKAPA